MREIEECMRQVQDAQAKEAEAKDAAIRALRNALEATCATLAAWDAVSRVTNPNHVPNRAIAILSARRDNWTECRTLVERALTVSAWNRLRF